MVVAVTWLQIVLQETLAITIMVSDEDDMSSDDQLGWYNGHISLSSINTTYVPLVLYRQDLDYLNNMR